MVPNRFARTVPVWSPRRYVRHNHDAVRIAEGNTVSSDANVQNGRNNMKLDIFDVTLLVIM